MRRKTLWMLLMALFLMATLTGCQLALEEKPDSIQEDLMIGMFVTTEHLNLFDMESWMNDNIDQILDGGEIDVGMDSRYQNRLYATVTKDVKTDEVTGETFKDWSIDFEGLEGISFFDAKISDDESGDEFIMGGNSEAISHMRSHFISSDEGERIELEGTIYIVPSNRKTFYFNPVFQDRDGRIYLTAGTGMSSSWEGEGAQTTHTSESTMTETKDGETLQRSTLIKLSIAGLYPSEKIVILQMDENSQILSREEYLPESMPQTLEMLADTAYIIAENYKPNGISRTLCGPDEDYLETFRGREDGICLPQSTFLDWNTENTIDLQTF